MKGVSQEYTAGGWARICIAILSKGAQGRSVPCCSCNSQSTVEVKNDDFLYIKMIFRRILMSKNTRLECLPISSSDFVKEL